MKAGARPLRRFPMADTKPPPKELRLGVDHCPKAQLRDPREMREIAVGRAKMALELAEGAGYAFRRERLVKAHVPREAVGVESSAEIEEDRLELHERGARRASGVPSRSDGAWRVIDGGAGKAVGPAGRFTPVVYPFAPAILRARRRLPVRFQLPIECLSVQAEHLGG